jgi:hypothetical protein
LTVVDIFNYSVSIATDRQSCSNDEGESVMSLQQAAAEFQAKVQGMLGEKFSILTGDMERVRAAGTVANALKVGQSAPDFTSPDAFGNPVSLKVLLAQGISALYHPSAGRDPHPWWRGRSDSECASID